jgi:cell filamentation protein
VANPYFDAVNRVNFNKLGITDADKLKYAEYRTTMLRGREILNENALGPVDSYDFKHLQAIHRHLFKKVYDWAGKPRTLPGSWTKFADRRTLTVFSEAKDFEPKWQALEKKTNAFAAAKGLTFEQKVAGLVDIFADANHIHPFPEGNGRTLQVFMLELAREQGVALDFDKAKKSGEWNRASAISGQWSRLFEGTVPIPQPPDREPIGRIFASMATPLAKEEPTKGRASGFLDFMRRAIMGSNAEHKQAIEEVTKETGQKEPPAAAPKPPQPKKRRDFDQGL